MCAHTCMDIYTMRIYIHIHVHAYVITVYSMYIHVCTFYMFILLYSTACLYNKSSEGVNRFCCSSSILGRKPPSKASACDILLPWAATGTGSLLSNECSLSKPASSWLSKPCTLYIHCTYMVHTLTYYVHVHYVRFYNCCLLRIIYNTQNYNTQHNILNNKYSIMILYWSCIFRCE